MHCVTSFVHQGRAKGIIPPKKCAHLPCCAKCIPGKCGRPVEVTDFPLSQLYFYTPFLPQGRVMVATARATMNRRRPPRARNTKDLAQKEAKGAAKAEGKVGSRKGEREGARKG